MRGRAVEIGAAHGRPAGPQFTGLPPRWTGGVRTLYNSVTGARVIPAFVPGGDGCGANTVRMSDKIAAIRVGERRRGLMYAQRTPESSDLSG